MRITVIGGTGLIGSKIVASLARDGHDVFSAAPNTGVDTLTGKGLGEAIDGAEVVIDVSNSPSLDGAAALDFFQTAGRTIAAAEKAAGVRHHLALSVVGTERLQESGYFRAKLAQEKLIRESGIPFSVVHATQFFEFLRGIAASAADGDSVRLSNARFQPMAAQDVAAAMVDAALAEPTHGTIEVAGPEAFHIDALVARVLAYDKDPRKVIADPEAPYFGIRLDDAALMPGPNARLGTTRFDWWLANVPPPPPRK
ncbi:SDR family oxidoreductase [Sphingomonas sp. LM7]|uniref:SDR family oxidoreductase n=1 Tax=Sphingomonas sp. LM7 TaxID=1938607 RepID=UPI000983ECF5|nr:SDR family oxidoreductase [Sphingomonas sp. LM7]AQR75348.1 NmrA family transcriptional regulator [Sphingomonas sp. LM7]